MTTPKCAHKKPLPVDRKEGVGLIEGRGYWRPDRLGGLASGQYA